MLNWTVVLAAGVGWTKGVRSWGRGRCTTRLADWACWLIDASLLNMVTVKDGTKMTVDSTIRLVLVQRSGSLANKVYISPGWN